MIALLLGFARMRVCYQISSLESWQSATIVATSSSGDGEGGGRGGSQFSCHVSKVKGEKVEECVPVPMAGPAFWGCIRFIVFNL